MNQAYSLKRPVRKVFSRAQKDEYYQVAIRIVEELMQTLLTYNSLSKLGEATVLNSLLESGKTFRAKLQNEGFYPTYIERIVNLELEALCDRKI